MWRWRRLRQLGLALRCVEAGAAVLLLTWSSARLPAAARSSADLLRALAAALLSPRAVFLLGNAIILLLFSGKLSPAPCASSPSAGPDGGVDMYDFVEGHSKSWYSLPPPAAAEEVVFEDKAVCVETRQHGYRRSRSERMEPRRRDVPELRRAETEVGRKEAAEEEEKRSMEDDEKFRREVEAFIAKELRFRREEALAIVSSSAGPPEPIEMMCICAANGRKRAFNPTSLLSILRIIWMATLLPLARRMRCEARILNEVGVVPPINQSLQLL